MGGKKVGCKENKLDIAIKGSTEENKCFCPSSIIFTHYSAH